MDILKEFGMTPGPWGIPHFARKDIDCECGYLFTEDDPGCRCIATIHYKTDDKDSEYFNKETAIANARAISLVPKMIELLVDATGVIFSNDTIKKSCISNNIHKLLEEIKGGNNAD